MKLVALRLENFRSFEHCELDLQREGLIGVSGPNGAGKSTLLSAINYALFGRGRGSRERPPERDDRPRGSKCEVELEFILDDRRCVVVRGPNKAELAVDGEPRVSTGQEPLTREITEMLGIGQRNFAMTFYARQREMQALKHAQNREAALEALLGIDQVRSAHNLALEALREQEAAARALAEGLPSLAEAEAVLVKAEEDARLREPAVEQARQLCAETEAGRDMAWEAVSVARARVEEAFALESKAAVAASELAAAQAREKAAREALAEATRAAEELVEVTPIAARAEELRARDRTLELEAQATAQAAALREKRHQAQVAAVAAADEVDAKPDPSTRLAEAEDELKTARGELETATTEILAASSHHDAVRAAAAEAAEKVSNGRRALELDEEIRALLPFREAAEERSQERAALEAEARQVAAEVAEEREHYEHVKRDGPKATCPRCKQPYAGRFESIVAEFEETLKGLDRREIEIAARLAEILEEAEDDAPKLTRLKKAEADRAALGEASAAVEALEATASEAEAARWNSAQALEELNTKRDALAETIKALEGEIESVREDIGAREQLVARRREAENQVAVYEAQLAELSPDGYDADAHEEVRQALGEAVAAEGRCTELQALAGQREILTKRLTSEERLAAGATETHAELATAAEKRAADKTAQVEAEAAYEKARAAHEQAAQALRGAEQQAIAESSAVERARAELEAARRQKGQLDKVREEESMRRVVATVLEQYRIDVQQEAVPSLEQETADLLRRVTRGRYSDVQITSEGELRVHDMGTAHDLDRFSGGEQDLAELCMRIALSKVLARRSGMDARFIILDEVFGSQDRDRRAALVEALRELDQEFAQVLVVSHFDDFMDQCALQVRVRSIDGTSRAELTTG